VALQRLRRRDEALASFERVLAIRPDFAEAWYCRGNALQSLNRTAEALASYDRALAIQPEYAEALNYRGIALQILRRHDEALASYDRALANAPDYAEALINRGGLLRALRRPEEALASYARALALSPDSPYLPGTWLNTRMQVCDWTGLTDACQALAAGIDAGRRAASPFALLAVPVSLPQRRHCAEIFVQDKFPPGTSVTRDWTRATRDRIRLGYFSADFHDHPTAYLLAELIERHDRTRFEVLAFSFGPPATDAMRARLTNAFDRFIDVRNDSGAAIGTLARELEVDIAVDLKGFTEDCRTDIFAGRAAPLQVNYLGFPGTMGAAYMDYLIADRTLIPDEHRAGYAEKIVYLPHSYQPNDVHRVISERRFTRRELGLPERGFVFCCFNINWKVTPEFFDIWMRLLVRVEGSVLWLIEGNPAAVRNLRAEAEKRGIAGSRLVFAPHMNLPEHLARHRVADLFLDTLPCNAHTTASDALWAGLPVLTCLGETFAGRVAASLLGAVGLPELVTESPGAYEARALQLATDSGTLAALRQRLAASRLTAPLFDTGLFTRHIEAAYAAMWARHQAGLPPDHLVIPA
jgi:predicted O-linked N-acetylglucosamine transferase (SPINDLY family)